MPPIVVRLCSAQNECVRKYPQVCRNDYAYRSTLGVDESIVRNSPTMKNNGIRPATIIETRSSMSSAYAISLPRSFCPSRGGS
jgi:hypothetical protein